MGLFDLADFERRHDFARSAAEVARVVEAAVGDPLTRLSFLAAYTSWNGFFGAGVSTLAGRIARTRRHFLDPGEPILALADRSVYVAGFFFDAARDEFDDATTVERDTHRCLAQAFVHGLIGYAREVERIRGLDEPTYVNKLIEDPPWLQTLNQRVALGYGDRASDLLGLFRAMGYHLGSELLADREFSILDRTLRARAPTLVRYLEATQIDIAGQSHSAYLWVSAHSGEGGAAEAAHFAWAVEGVERALKYVATANREALLAAIFEGFAAFAADHQTFFASALPARA